MQDEKINSNSKNISIHSFAKNNITAYEKVVEEKAEDVVCQINEEFNVGEKALFTNPKEESDKQTNKLDMNITLPIESSNHKNVLTSNSHHFSRKRRNLYIALLLLFIVGIGAGVGIFFGINKTKEENMILTSKPIDSNSFFQEKIKEKAADEPILVRNFQVGESYLYKKSSRSQIYKSTNPTEKNITITESYTYYYVSEKKENGDLKIFFHLHNLTQFDEKKENKTMLIHSSFDILNQISKNASLLNEIYKVPNMTFNMGYFTLCRNGSYYDFSIHEKFFEDFIFLAKSLIEEFTPILSAKIYQNKGKRMLLEHQQNSTISGHFDGNLTEDATLLIKTTDSEDYKKDGLGEAAQVETKQISNFDKNGTLINSTQNSKVEFNLDNPKNEDEKEYKANSTSSNSTYEKEKIYNETVRKNDTEQKYVYNTTNQDSESNKTQSSLLKNSTLVNSNTTTKNSEANSSSSNANATENSLELGSNSTNLNNTNSSNETDTTVKVNNTSEVAEALNGTNADINESSNNTNGNGTSNRLLQEKKPETQKDEMKGKIIQETSDTFGLISLTIFDEFYKNISTTFLNFEYDENEKPNIEEIENSDANNTQLSTSLYDDSDLELKSVNTTKTENKTKIKESSFNNKNSTENKSLDNSNNTMSKNSTKKKAFVAFTDYQNKFKTNATNEDPSKFPSSKNFRLLLSSSLLEDKVFRMNIISTNILGMSISFYAEGAIKVLDNKLEFGVYSNVMGLKIPLYQGSLDIKISEALKNLLMYNQNLLNQILSLTNFPFADLIKDVSSLRERILKTIDLDSIKANFLSNLKEYVPDLIQTLQAFSTELKTHVQNQLVDLKDEFSKIFSETVIDKYKNFKDTLQAEILSLTKGKWDEIKNFIGEAQQIYNNLAALPQELVDKVIKFKSDLRENLEKKLKEKMLSGVDALIKGAYDEIQNYCGSVKGLNLFDLLIRQEKEEFGFIDFLNAFSESEDMVLKAIESAYAAEKEKLSVFIESEFSYLRKTIFEAADVNEVFSKLTTDMDSFVTKLKSKVKNGVTVSESLELQKIQTLIDEKFSVIANYNSKIELKSYVTIQASAVISSVNSKVSSTVSAFKTKSSVLIESLTEKANECFNKQMKRLESLEVEVTEFYSSSSQKIVSINKQIEDFVSSNTDKFLNGIFTSSIKKRFLSGQFDLFTEVINAVKSFENMVDTFQPQLIGLDIAKDVHDKVTNLRNSLTKGLILAETELDKVLSETTALFKLEGRGLFKSFISNRVLSGLKLDFKVSNLSAISSNFNGFKDTFKSAVDKFLGFKNTFRGVIDNAKNKISSLINLDGMNFSRNIVSKNLLRYKYKHPIPVLFFIIWLEAHFTTNMSMNLYSKASLFGIEVGFDFGLNASMGGSAYVDFFLVHAGVSANANLVELNNYTGAGYKFLQLAGNFKSCGSIRFLNVSVGIFVRYLKIRIAWHCWRIRIWFIRITICVPYLQFYMSNPHYLVSYNSPYAVNSNFCFWNLDF